MNQNFQFTRQQMVNIPHDTNTNPQPPPYSMPYQQSSMNYQMNTDTNYTHPSMSNYSRNMEQPLSVPPPNISTHISHNPHSNPPTPLIIPNVNTIQNPINSDSKLIPFKTDPISIIKALLPELKETLKCLFRICGQTTNFNIALEELSKAMPQTIDDQSLEKCTQDILALIDLMELNMKTALDFYVATQESHKNSPIPVLLSNKLTSSDPGFSQDSSQSTMSMTYQNYLNQTSIQVSLCQQVKDTILECLKI